LRDPLAIRHRELVGLGLVGGLIPSGSALLLLLSAIALDRVPYGLALIAAFGAGMAAVLSGIATGVVVLRRSAVLSSLTHGDRRLARTVELAPLASSALVIVIGLVLTTEALALSA
jgi:ABC-type nickel/cobalt efflux system permease component RcnA